ncbi:MAG: 50S ribosomal protein L11 [Patescibacteria group bacterium]
MATKKVTKNIKVKIQAGKATPAPPLGPALGQAGINIGDFVTKFNAATAKMPNEKVTAHISVYEDRTYSFVITGASASDLILKTAGIESGSGKNVAKKVGKITKAQAREIAEKKMADLNANDIEAAARIIAGTARSMGVEVKD